MSAYVLTYVEVFGVLGGEDFRVDTSLLGNLDSVHSIRLSVRK